MESLPMADEHCVDGRDSNSDEDGSIDKDDLFRVQLEELQAQLDVHEKYISQAMKDKSLSRKGMASEDMFQRGDKKSKEIHVAPKQQSNLLLCVFVLGGVIMCLIAIAFEIGHQRGRMNVASSAPRYHRPLFHRKFASPAQKAPKADVHPKEYAMPEYPVSFSVHFNGDGKGDGIPTRSSSWDGLNDLIRETCAGLKEVQELAGDSKTTLERLCEPNNGARLFDDTGNRVWSFVSLRNDTRTYIVPQGLQFVWPNGKVGREVEADSVPSPLPGKKIKLRQLSESPLVFSVENFMTPEEMDSIMEYNMNLVKPSEVGFSGWRDKTRTSSTSWDFHSWGSARIRRRSFALLGIDFQDDMADAFQVLRYNTTEWYKPHTDYFDESSYDGHDPMVNNGTNRFATVFLYMSDVEEGGHTVFPLSTTHEGYNGEQLVHPGTDKTPGYIAQSDAEWVCNTSSTALRSSTKAGSVLIFYSQKPNGALDKYSLHGGCPVISGVKWSANVWVWNRPKPVLSKIKNSRKPAPDLHSIQLSFQNHRSVAVNVFWDDGSPEMVFQLQIPPNEVAPMTTYHGHRFEVRDANSNETVAEFIAHDKYKGMNHVVHVNY
mmetsp:Transcript_10850/g.17768  ORF Transcript_10850/g.17768 Transcript_10850/m.17768 type:complete len:602 (+) Transcript_10850:450-2255(+)